MGKTFQVAFGRRAPTNFRGKQMQTEHRVAIVLDESFGKRLLLLAQRLHVWAVESPANAEAANTFLKMDVSLPSEPLERGITTFMAQGSSRCETLVAVLEDVDEHHGEYAHSPPWTVLEVYGLDETDADRVGFAEYGITQVIRTEFGLEVRRPSPPTSTSTA